MIRRAIEGGLGDADEKAHKGDPFVRTDGEVANVFATRKRVAQANGARLAIGPDDWNPRVSRKIHQTPPATHAERPRDE